MPITSLLLQTVNTTVNVFDMKLNFSSPKIYTGGVLISEWSKLSKLQKKEGSISKVVVKQKSELICIRRILHFSHL